MLPIGETLFPVGFLLCSLRNNCIKIVKIGQVIFSIVGSCFHFGNNCNFLQFIFFKYVC